jgi:lipopolysaccharide/colanic/teichoic acid biosynthesis glycosyltransferase
MSSTRRADRVKRGLDVIVSAVGLILSMPVQALVATLVRTRLGAPALFRQERPGKEGRIFTIVKFRTMLEPDAEAGLVSDTDRLTQLGAVLRSTSLDELPTLWNVLRGDMSLVGPRPLLPQYLDRYSPEQRRRHDVRPGITGLAQVSGRNSLSWNEKLDLDLQYVQQRSMALDLRVLVTTVAQVLRRRGISADGEVTMPEFLGVER